MRNLKLKIEYDGSNYCGWQIQSRSSNKKSIQATLEKYLRKILQEKIRLVVSGRTDAGVHAKAQVANFNTNSEISLDKLQRALNGLLPQDIAITGIEEVPADFHSRFSAKSKIYRYTIVHRNYPSVFLRGYSYFYPYPLDIKLMKAEAKILLGKHDFKCFQAADKKDRSSLRTIKKLSIIKVNDLLRIDIEADGFLYNMVRNIVGTLIEIGRGRFPRGYMNKLLVSRNRKLAGPTIPASGLSLIKVKY
jgi:tRNA pseudouridine38-40 synthase